MRKLSANEEVILTDGYQMLEVDTKEEAQFSFVCRGKSEVFLKVKNAKQITLKTKTEENGELTFLIWNESETPCEFEESHELLKDASLQLSYGEVNQTEASHHLVVDLLEPGAHSQVGSATLTRVKKSFTMSVVSHADHTYGQIDNYGVVLTGGNYFVDATGAIKKGAYASESHQTSCALCFDEGMKANILPRLLIDENDVQASHATSLGSVDEEHMYYMQARGLSPQQCTALISTGYLMPVTRTIQDETLQQELRAELERKIHELCSI